MKTHKWETSSWGVIFGVTKCIACGETATKSRLYETCKGTGSKPSTTGEP